MSCRRSRCTGPGKLLVNNIGHGYPRYLFERERLVEEGVEGFSVDLGLKLPLLVWHQVNLNHRNFYRGKRYDRQIRCCYFEHSKVSNSL